MSTEQQDQESNPVFHKSEGVTQAERYLQRLAEKSFLSLWSYPNVHKNEGLTKKNGTSQEVCDLLVVFENHLIIFSDKDCAFPNTGNLDLDWSRWYRKAILKSAQQIWGAESHILKNPDNLFLDAACTKPFPIGLPSSETVKVHRILVAHGASERCKQEMGGSGSLMIVPGIIGEQHVAKQEDGGVPFAIGQINPSRGYIHIFDDVALNIVMSELDTITDFIDYVVKKEMLVSSGKLKSAADEADLLAIYLQHLDQTGRHDFVLSQDTVESGWWVRFHSSPAYNLHREEINLSYKWDTMIETCLHQLYYEASLFASNKNPADYERFLRMLARERRFRRQTLSRLLSEFVASVPPHMRATCTVTPIDPGDTCYVFDVYPELEGVQEYEYRQARNVDLVNRCMITKVQRPDEQYIIGIAAGEGFLTGAHDIVCIDAKKWTPELQSEAERILQEYEQAGFLGQQIQHRSVEHQYSLRTLDYNPHSILSARMNGGDRNSLCWCGSGEKFKKCHG